MSDGGIFRECSLHRSIEAKSPSVPGPKSLPVRVMRIPYVIVGDEAFPLKEYLMKPYLQRTGLDEEQRMFNYRLLRARRIVENAFGILWNRFREIIGSVFPLPFQCFVLFFVCFFLFFFFIED